MLQTGEIEAGRLLAVPGRPNDELRGGHPNQQQKRDGFRLLAIVGRQNRLCVGLKQSGNSRVSKMIRIEVISPYAFDSNHTSATSPAQIVQSMSLFFIQK